MLDKYNKYKCFRGSWEDPFRWKKLSQMLLYVFYFVQLQHTKRRPSCLSKDASSVVEDDAEIRLLNFLI